MVQIIHIYLELIVLNDRIYLFMKRDKVSHEKHNKNIVKINGLHIWLGR